VAKIVGEYREMPGLSLNVHQAARLFGVSQLTCQAVLEDLVRRGSLEMFEGQYRKTGR